MKNFTFKMLLLLFLGFLGFTGFSQEWNFSSASFNALGSVTATKTVEGLTMYATASATIDFDANSKSLDGMDFTSRLKFGGTGSFGTDGLPVSRVVAFNVAGNTTITVMGMSSSSSADRQLIVAAGKMETELGRFAALGASISKGTFTYTGGPTTIYLFSPSSGVNLYYLKAVPTTTGLSNQQVPEMMVYPNPASGKVFISLNESTQIGIFNIAGVLMKQQLVSVLQNSINISDLHSGIYFVKTMDSKNITRKLIIR